MSKKGLIAGAIIMMFLSFAFISMFVDVAEKEQFLPSPIISDTRTINIIGWAAALYVIGFIVFAIRSVTKVGGPFEKINERYTVKAVIPGYFFLVTLPLVIGIFFIVAFHQVEWGISLSCISFPTMIIFLVIALKKQERA